MKDITREKIRIAEKTNMIELMEDEYDSFPDDEEFKAEYAKKKVKSKPNHSAACIT